MKIFVCGQKVFGAAVLQIILQRGHEVAGVSAPVFNGDGSRPDRLREAAERHSIPCMIAGSLNAGNLPDGVDLIIAAHSHDFIGKKTRGKTRLGAIGYHPSLLPLHRGRDAVRWAVKMRERVTGGTVYWLNDHIDGGDIAAQEHCFIHPKDNADSLWREKLFPMGLRLFSKVLADLERGVIVAVPQDESLATWEPSMGRPPLYRPDLLQLGAPPDGFQFIRIAHEIEHHGIEQCG